GCPKMSQNVPPAKDVTSSWGRAGVSRDRPRNRLVTPRVTFASLPPRPRVLMRSLFAALTLALLTGPALAEPAKDPRRKYPKILKPGDHGVGRLAPDLGFTDVYGKAGKLSDYKDKKAVVIA